MALIRETDCKTGVSVLREMTEVETAEWLASTRPPMPEARERAKATLAAQRWAAEQRGITVGGIPVSTDMSSQIKVLGAAVAAQMDPGYTVEWKTPVGFISLNATDVIGIAQAIRAHIQACFDNEAALTAAIDAADDHDALEAIDLGIGWP